MEMLNYKDNTRATISFNRLKYLFISHKKVYLYIVYLLALGETVAQPRVC